MTTEITKKRYKNGGGPRTVHGKRISRMNSLKDGSSSPVIVTSIGKTIRKSYLPWLQEALPWLTRSDEPILEILILKRARLILLHRWLAENGDYDKDGNLRSQAARAEKAENEVVAIIEKLGGTPRARLDLGLKALEGGDLAARAAALRERSNDL